MSHFGDLLSGKTLKTEIPKTSTPVVEEHPDQKRKLQMHFLMRKTFMICQKKNLKFMDAPLGLS